MTKCGGGSLMTISRWIKNKNLIKKTGGEESNSSSSFLHLYDAGYA